MKSGCLRKSSTDIDESYRNLLDAHKLKRSCLPAFILEAQLNHIVYTFHERVETLSLSMTSP